VRLVYSIDGSRLRALREAAGLSQVSLAERIGRSRETVARLEREVAGVVRVGTGKALFDLFGREPLGAKSFHQGAAPR
jgi:transcriptional regulator with XRE-family HTH domain